MMLRRPRVISKCQDTSFNECLGRRSRSSRELMPSGKFGAWNRVQHDSQTNPRVRIWEKGRSRQPRCVVCNEYKEKRMKKRPYLYLSIRRKRRMISGLQGALRGHVCRLALFSTSLLLFFSIYGRKCQNRVTLS